MKIAITRRNIARIPSIMKIIEDTYLRSPLRVIKPLSRSSRPRGPGEVTYWFQRRCDAGNFITIEVPRIRRAYVHKRIAEAFRGVFTSIAAAGLDHLIDLSDYGGTYSCRKVRGGRSYSPHAWGIAIDLNVHHFRDPSNDTEFVRRERTNYHCAADEVAYSLQNLAPYFNAWGFAWGGDFSAKYRDPMHFEATELTVKILESGLTGPEYQYLNLIRQELDMPSVDSGGTQAIKVVHSGELWLDRKMLKGVIHQMNPSEKKVSLTKKEKEIVSLICEGLRNKEIAQKLNISEQTVKSHCNRIFKKVGVSDRLQLALYTHKVWSGVIY